MSFHEQILRWCREGEDDLRRENRLFAYAQLHAHAVFLKHSRAHGRWYMPPSVNRMRKQP